MKSVTISKRIVDEPINLTPLIRLDLRYISKLFIDYWYIIHPFTAHFPHIFRTCSASYKRRWCGICAENVRKWCGKPLSHLPIVGSLFGFDLRLMFFLKRTYQCFLKES